MQNRTAANVTEKKKKGKPSMGRLRLLRFVAFFLLFACVVITILAILGPNIHGQIRQTSLAIEYIPIATMLLDTPSSTVVESENITLELWDVRENSYGEVDEVCVSVTLNYEALSETTEQYYYSSREMMEQYFSSRLLINKSWAIGAKNTLMGSASLRLPLSKLWCGWGELETGIHLVEFELRDSMFGEAIYTHQWAIEIEADNR
jgi:hypothetical protein